MGSGHGSFRNDPQSVNAFGGFKVQGRNESGDAILADALALQDAGCFAIVLELVPAELAARITAALKIPTIGIGAGFYCDGQVLVWTDLMGLTERPPGCKGLQKSAQRDDEAPQLDGGCRKRHLSWRSTDFSLIQDLHLTVRQYAIDLTR